MMHLFAGAASTWAFPGKHAFMKEHFGSRPPPFDRCPNEIPKNALKETISFRLEIPYLSKYEKSIEELKKTTKY